MHRIFMMIIAAGFGLTGCVQAVAATAGAAVKTTAGVAKTGAKVGAGAVKTGVKVVSSDADDKGARDKDTHEGGGHHDNNPRPFDETSDAMEDVDIALATARITGKRPLLVLGGNWCHDSRGLAAKFEEPSLSRVIADNYELVWVDVGHRDRNLHVSKRFGVEELYGTPTVLILSPEGALLNEDSVHDWRTADSKPFDETYDYFQSYAVKQ